MGCRLNLFIQCVVSLKGDLLVFEVRVLLTINTCRVVDEIRRLEKNGRCFTSWAQSTNIMAMENGPFESI